MEILIDIIKHFTVTTVCFLFFIKLRPLNLDFIKKALLCVSFIVLSSSLFVILANIFFVIEPYRTAIVIFTSSIIFAFLLKERIEIMMTSFILAFAFCYILNALASMLSFLLTSPFISSDSSDDGIRFAVTGAISVFAAILLIRIKVDFNPLFKKFANGIFLSISSVVIILYGLVRVEVSVSYERFFLLLAGFTLLCFAIYSWFRRENTISQNENAKDLINKKQQGILEQKEKDIAVLTNMHDYLASVVHRDDKKLDAMQRAVENLVMRSEQTDVLNDAQKILSEISISRDRAEKDFNKKLFNGKTLPLTGLQIVDAKFEMLSEKAMLKSVDFDLEVNGDESGFDQIIPQFDLANIIGDLAENAFIAVKHLDKGQPCHKVHFSIGKTDDEFELSVYDSGVPFRPDILLKLGVERITSHPDDGGSGYGYETIFELLKEYAASLMIIEYESAPYTYSKNITIRFDGKTEYIIKSFRADRLSKQNMNKYLTICTLG